MNGLPWAKIATDLLADPKVSRLARKNTEAEYLEALGAWLVVVLESWRCGTREVDDQEIPAGPLARLQAVGLLDEEGRIPVQAWTKWGARAVQEVRERENQRVQISHLGGLARASTAVRDDRGRLLPSSSRPLDDPQPTAGRDPAVIQPPPAKNEIEIEIEKKKVPRGESEGRSGITLSKAQHDQWIAFDEAAKKADTVHLWAPVKRAWIGRGLRHPPTEKQRAVLWEILDARPLDLPRWIREAPPEIRRSTDLLRDVLGRWHAWTKAESLDAKDRAVDRVAAAESLGAILGRVRADE